jgi:hypothetical protein
MTIIKTVISNFGIIQASDSNVTRSDSKEATSDPKVFPLGFCDAALAYAGTYRIGEERLNSWMPHCIDDYASSENSSLRGFAEHLKRCLETGMTDSQKTQNANLVHIAGYSSDESGIHPEFYFVRNTPGINPEDGKYKQPTGEFQISEDFWTRDYVSSRDRLNPSSYHSYFNGTPDGRIAFFAFDQIFNAYLQDVWGHSTWKFRPPRSLEELSSVIELQIRTIGILYSMSDYSAPLVGGEPQIFRIEPPSGALVLWDA